MSTTIVQSNNRFRLFGDVGIIKKLPSKVMEFGTGPFGDMFFEECSGIVLPKKIYSNDKDFIEHVLQTYKITEGSLGIMLSGKKGLGKSFTAQVLCDRLNLPVIKITGKVPAGVDLLSYLNKIEQEHIIFIDEFEKIFSVKEDNEMMTQNDFLSFLDNGSIGTKRLFIITANERVTEYLINRPTRIRYHRKYEKLDISVIHEIVDDLLVNADFRQDLVDNIPQREVNIDVLIRIIEEVNIHNKPYSKFKDFFNFESLDYELLEVRDANGAVLHDEIKVNRPIGRGTDLYYDRSQGEYVEVEEIISQTRDEMQIKTRLVNQEYYGDPSKPQYVYGYCTLIRKYNFLV